MQPTGLLAVLGTLAAFVAQVVATPTPASPALVPRSSPQPCQQRYVCPEPRPYPDTPDTGDDPGPTRFKCRIGSSVSDPNFAFCIYEKVSPCLFFVDKSHAYSRLLMRTGAEYGEFSWFYPQWYRGALLGKGDA